MALGRRKRNRQERLWVSMGDVRAGPGHRFYEALEGLLRAAGFDAQVEALCAAYYQPAGTRGRPSVPPGVYFRTLLIGYFEGIESERGICWRCADSLSLRAFLGLSVTDSVPDHSTLSRIRMRLPLRVFEEVFALVLSLVQEHGLLEGGVLGVDSTYLRADASMKSIVRRDTREDYAGFVKRLAEEAGVENPTAEDARRFDRSRKGKKTSNGQWLNPHDPDARIARLKDGRTRLAYKPEHVVDLESGVIVTAGVHAADEADGATIEDSLRVARENLARVGKQHDESDSAAADAGEGNDDNDHDDRDGSGLAAGRRVDASSGDAPATQRTEEKVKLVTDKGYHKASVLRALKEDGYRTYIPEPKQRHAKRRWGDKGGRATAVAYYQNRARMSRKHGKSLQKKRGELLERSFAHTCESGAARRTRLRGRINVAKRYILTAASMNLGCIMRKLVGMGTPRGFADQVKGLGNPYAHGVSRGFGSPFTNLALLALRWLTIRFAVPPKPHDPRVGPAIAGTG